MTTLDSALERNGKEGLHKNEFVLFAAIFLVYLFLRIYAWKNTVLLEDTDSLFYLRNIETFLTFDPQKIIDLDPDSTPLYPFFAALASLPGWSVETGARITSLLFSSALFVAVWGIGRQIAKPFEVTLGLLILTFSPVLISLSFAVITEPSYVAVTYLGLWLFWTQYKNSKVWKTALLGLIFGSAFLARTEGILFVALIPFLQTVYFYWQGNIGSAIKKAFSWTLIFTTCFALIATPQIWRVSHKIGSFAINGRQLWSLYLRIPDGKSMNEKIFGLDFSPKQINIQYIKSNPKTVYELHSKVNLTNHFKKLLKVFNRFYQVQLGVMIGPLILISFAFGIMALHQSRRTFEVFLILAFIIFNMLAPLLHSVIIRNIMIIAPIIFLTAGIGVVNITNSVLHGYEKHSLLEKILPLLFLMTILAAWFFPLYKAINPPKSNAEYSPAELAEPIKILKTVAQNDLHRPPIITAQRHYISYFANGEHFYLPFTDYNGLVRFCNLNHVDFLYLKHSRVKAYPFFHTFHQHEPNNNFVLIYSGLDAGGRKVELYRFVPTLSIEAQMPSP